jgi:hypothetical protein
MVDFLGGNRKGRRKKRKGGRRGIARYDSLTESPMQKGDENGLRVMKSGRRKKKKQVQTRSYKR